MFIAQRLVGPRKQLKQIIQIEHNIVTNPSWLEANDLPKQVKNERLSLKRQCSLSPLSDGDSLQIDTI